MPKVSKEDRLMQSIARVNELFWECAREGEAARLIREIEEASGLVFTFSVSLETPQAHVPASEEIPEEDDVAQADGFLSAQEMHEIREQVGKDRAAEFEAEAEKLFQRMVSLPLRKRNWLQGLFTNSMPFSALGISFAEFVVPSAPVSFDQSLLMNVKASDYRDDEALTQGIRGILSPFQAEANRVLAPFANNEAWRKKMEEVFSAMLKSNDRENIIRKLCSVLQCIGPS